MKNTSLRALTCTLCATLALAGGLVLGGCSGGPNVEELVRELLNYLVGLQPRRDA